MSDIGLRHLLSPWRRDVVHIHWPESVLNSASAARALLGGTALVVGLGVTRAAGRPVVWTAHNTEEHEPRHRIIGRLLWRALEWAITDVIVLGESGRTALTDRRPRLAAKTTALIPHGHYHPTVHSVDRTAARTELGLADSEKILLSYGYIRPYKGHLALLDAFEAAPETALRLLIVGAPTDADLAAQIRSRSEANPSVRLDLRHQCDERQDLFFSAADCVVVPYTSGLSSGTALLALSYDRPVIAPSISGFVELADEVGSQWVHLYDGELTADDLAAAARSTPGGRPDLSRREWPEIGRAHREVYLAASSRSRPWRPAGKRGDRR